MVFFVFNCFVLGLCFLRFRFASPWEMRGYVGLVDVLLTCCEAVKKGMHRFFGVLLVFWVSVKRVMHCFFIVELPKDGGPKSGAPPEKRKERTTEKQQKNSVQLAEQRIYKCGVLIASTVGC